MTAPLPELPPPLPELDFPAMEASRKDMVRAYGRMLERMQRAMARAMEGYRKDVTKAEAPGFIQGALEPQETRRDELKRILVNLGEDPSSFDEGGEFQNTSDDELRDLAKRAIQAGRKQARVTKSEWSLYGDGRVAYARQRRRHAAQER